MNKKIFFLSFFTLVDFCFAQTVQTSAMTNSPVIPPPLSTPTPLEPIAKSLPATQTDFSRSEFISTDNRRGQIVSPPVLIDYFISEEGLQEQGEIVEIEKNSTTAAPYNTVFAVLKERENSGKFLVVKDKGLVASIGFGANARLIAVQGEVEVQNSVNDPKQIYRMKVIKSFHSIDVGSVLIRDTIQKISLRNQGPVDAPGNLRAKIIGGPFEVSRQLLAFPSIVFIDAGHQYGVREGQLLSIFASQEIRNSDTNLEQNERVIGAIKVAKVTPHFATAVIVNSSEGVRIGDIVASSTVIQGGHPELNMDSDKATVIRQKGGLNEDEL